MTSSGPLHTIGQQVLRRGAAIVLDRQAKLHVTGTQHIPGSGPCVLVARHYHHLLDGCALYQATDRSLHILVGLDWAGTGMLRSVMEGLSRMVHWPIVLRPDALDRQSAPAGRRAEGRRLLREATRHSLALLEAGHVLVIFPEGYPVVDPHADGPRASMNGLLPFQPGVARLVSIAAQRLNREVPIVPVGFTYSRESSRWDITMRIGPAVLLDGNLRHADLLTLLECRVADLSGIVRDDSATSIALR
jgi:1-acyl-sn-glycerol-3-phosphate acyltransferase